MPNYFLVVYKFIIIFYSVLIFPAEKQELVQLVYENIAGDIFKFYLLKLALYKNWDRDHYYSNLALFQTLFKTAVAEHCTGQECSFVPEPKQHVIK